MAVFRRQEGADRTAWEETKPVVGVLNSVGSNPCGDNFDHNTKNENFENRAHIFMFSILGWIDALSLAIS